MSAVMNVTSPSLLAGVPSLLWQQIRRIGPLGAIILLHVGFFYALQSGLLRQATQAVLPKEVFATFITPQPAPEPPKPQPATPKTVQVVKKAITHSRPAPVVNTTPSPQAITVAPSAALPEPASPAVVAPPASATPPASAQPRTISSAIEYLQAPQPDYPPISRRIGEEGKAILRVLVNEKGRPERVEVQKSSGSSRLDEAARQAVLRAIFKPFMEDGKAVAAFAIVPIKFQLDN
jgi:periplasmic protein TonB